MTQTINNDLFRNRNLFELYSKVHSEMKSGWPNDLKWYSAFYTLGGTCLGGEERTAALMNRIYGISNIGDIAIDLGAGSGILGLTALLKGAEHVYFVERDKDLISFMEYITKKLGYQNRTTLIEADVRTDFDLPKGIKFDHVIAELIATGLRREPQVMATKTLRERGYCHDQTRYTPLGAISYIHLTDRESPLTERIEYSRVNFSGSLEDEVDKEISTRLIRDGHIIEAIIATELFYEDGSKTGAFGEDGELGCFCSPVDFWFYPGSSKLGRGQELKVHIEYKFGDNGINITVKGRLGNSNTEAVITSYPPSS